LKKIVFSSLTESLYLNYGTGRPQKEHKCHWQIREVCEF
jgi:hypothetical protein